MYQCLSSAKYSGMKIIWICILLYILLHLLNFIAATLEVFSIRANNAFSTVSIIYEAELIAYNL